MPPLYRMPVFYVGLLLLGAAGLAVRGSRIDAASRGASASRPVASARPAPRKDDSTPSEGSAADGILRAASGVRRKVVVKVLGERCRETPGGAPVGPLLDYFSIHFVRGEQGAGELATVQIGPATGPALGWLPATSVFEWDTRIMALPTSDPSRPPLDVYRERDCLVAAIEKRPCPRHGSPEKCPIVGSEPAAPSSSDVVPVIGLPILRSEDHPGAGQTSSSLFEVAALVRETVPPPPPKEPPADLRLALRQVYIAFVLDTTHSMQRAIDAVKQVVGDLADEDAPQNRGLVLRVALVEFRDEDREYPRVTPFMSPSALRGALTRVQAADRGDGTISEAVLDGVEAALPDSRRLDWPTGPTGDASTKLLVLIGDSPDKSPDDLRARLLADRARRARVTIAAVELDYPLLTRSETALLRSQWSALADGGYRPETAGEGTPLAPLLPRVSPDPGGDRSSAVAEIAGTIRELIADRGRDALRIAAERQAEAERKLREYANSQRLTLDRLAPVLVDLHRGEDQPRYRPDPRFGGQKAPSIRRGWIADRLGEKPMASLAILMTRAELTTLIDELESFQQAAEGARSLADLRAVGLAAAAGETAFLASDRGDRTFGEHLRRQGFPSPRPGSLLGRSQADLIQADRLYRDELRARLQDVLPRLDRLRTSPDWDDPLKTVDGMRLVPYGWIDL